MIIYTLPVKHRTPESIMSSIAPLLVEQGTLSAAGNKIIIKTTRENFQELALLIEELDTPAAQLLVSVRQASIGQQSQSGFNSYGTITREKILLNGQPAPKTSHQVSVKRSTGWGEKSSNYQLRAQEGEPVYLQTGQQIPIQSRYGVVGGTTTEYHPVTSGISFVARLVGNTVILDITQQQQEPVGNNRIETQSLHTQVSGRLGEWIALGGTQGRFSSTEQGILRRQTEDRNDTLNISVKIDRY
ncbi:hypothetical protein [Simiduia aestuariiviva]|uniref:Type II secretory pathway component GspD/PulD (Secretin) n=1 Tax=Simiduia aestuariiviva TaxID=1510459 RepID=A0A839USD1_9GAMM|nr:hypothetical protein [Simiduia aestuariiviva]MBB3168297.1 type II secretory pathway component GspD/PulD (secretin) [Simiduia aestuariiviva]